VSLLSYPGHPVVPWTSCCGPWQSSSRGRDSLHPPTGWIHLLFSGDT
jgi:hypothetical protein